MEIVIMGYLRSNIQVSILNLYGQPVYQVACLINSQ